MKINVTIHSPHLGMLKRSRERNVNDYKLINTMNKLELVRTYEPVLLFSKNGDGANENFFPMAINHFLAESRLYCRGQIGQIDLPGGLTLQTIANISPKESRYYYLSFTADKLIEQSPSVWEWLQNDGLVRFGVSGDEDSEENLAEVSYGLLDPIAKTQQLPPEVTEAAISLYKPYTDFNNYPPVYYYRLMNNRGYTVIQYWFFYAYNDWGTSHQGMNDHEGDWESVFVFLEEDTPVYAAYAAHTDGLKPYKWTEIEKYRGSHPIVYVGCGSHGSYAKKGVHKVSKVLNDYAQANSDTAIGPGTNTAWTTPVDLEQQPWALNFAGHWGTVFSRLGLERAATGIRGPKSPPWQFDAWERPVWAAKIDG
jgi:hypothetical protein